MDIRHLNRDKSSAASTQEFQNPYHPHPLILITDKSGGKFFKCAACLQYQFGSFFRCVNCNFDLDLKCAFLQVTTDEGQDQLHHLTHFHPLVANDKRQNNDDDVSCKICGEPSNDGLYCCKPCNFYLHQSCAKLQFPPKLQHFFHPCLLTLLLDKKGSKCKACGNFCDLDSYRCEPCNVSIGISCALLPLIRESLGQQQIYHFSHGHPLKLKEIKHEDEVLCSVCQKQYCSGQTYVCCSSKCKFFVHGSCFNLPPNIHHPFHPHHPLNLCSPIQRQSTPKCKVCSYSCHGFTNSCSHCVFHMHVECPVMISSIEYQGHHHNILFIDGLDPYQTHVDDDPSGPLQYLTAICSVCGTSCKYSAAMFRCVQCDFHLHLNCGPLPLLINQEDHPCPLKLTDSPVIVEGEDKNTDVFYCDICERERDPRLPVYYCSNGCAYLSEIKCVISEVLLSLRGEYGEIELQSAVFKHKTGKVICKGTIKGIELADSEQDSVADNDTEIYILEVNPSLTLNAEGTMEETTLNALTEPEMSEINIAFACALRNDWQWTDFQNFPSQDEGYTKFMASMDTFVHNPNLTELWGKRKKVVNVGNHLVISDLAPILEDLCSKYEDIIPESTRLQRSQVKTFFISNLCDTIRSMCTTRVVDISEATLFSWWRCLKTLQYVGFKVEFAMDRLKRVVHAYYALHVENRAKKDSKQIDREIEEVCQQMKELEAKLVALMERRKSTEPLKPASFGILAECIKEASVLKWMIAGEGLL